jgi:SagB-type dehydrogenase family enzyme
MKKINIDELLSPHHYKFETYHDATKIKKIPEKELSDKQWPKSWKESYYKAYPRFDEIKLPQKLLLKQVSFDEILSKRKSNRVFSNEKITTSLLGTLLKYGAGLNPNHQTPFAHRYYPSGGGRYPLEVYVVLLNGQLESGVYHYYPPNHSLEFLLPIKRLDYKSAFTPFNQKWTQKAGIILLITSVFKRSSIKYGENAYRFSLLEAGHMGQNISLLSAPLGLNCCAVAGYSSTYFEDLLGIDGVNESILYSFAIGKQP